MVLPSSAPAVPDPLRPAVCRLVECPHLPDRYSRRHLDRGGSQIMAYGATPRRRPASRDLRLDVKGKTKRRGVSRLTEEAAGRGGQVTTSRCRSKRGVHRATGARKRWRI